MTLNVGSEPRIRVDAVSKYFPPNSIAENAVVALSRVSFEIEEGEVLCLLGPSGCGKSTILNIIAGFEAASEGTVSCNGSRVLAPGPDRTVVFQTPSLFPWLTVAENIAFVLKYRGESRADAVRKTAEYMEAVDLKGFEDHYPYQLSGGMRQRVSLARALIGRPSVLLLDEPFGALDAQTRLAMQELLQKIWKNYQPTIFFITHDVEEAIFLADRILVMTPRPGQIYTQFTVGMERPRTYEVLTSDKFVILKEQILSLIHSGLRSLPKASIDKR